MRDTYCMMAFGNNHVAIKVQKALSEKGFRIAMMPTLRAITAGCGLSARFKPDNLESIQKTVAEMNIELSLYQYYQVEVDMGKCSVTKLETAFHQSQT